MLQVFGLLEPGIWRDQSVLLKEGSADVLVGLFPGIESGISSFVFTFLTQL